MPPSEPLISVVLPVRNGMPIVVATIESLERQSYRNFELIVQDSVSSDGSREYLQSITSLPRVEVVSETDSSLVQGYNRAFARCRGDLVVATACDEFLEDHALQTCVRWHEEHPDAVFVYGGSRLRDAAQRVVSDFQPPDFDLIAYWRLEMCPTTGGYFNRRLLGDAFHFDESLKSCPDFELITRMALQFGEHRIVTKRGFIMNALADRSSMSFRSESYDQFNADKTRILERVAGGIADPLLKDYFLRTTIGGLYAHAAAAVLDLDAAETEQFRRYAIEAGRRDPGSPKVIQLAQRSRYLEYSPETGELRPRKYVRPIAPPEDAETLAVDITKTHGFAVWEAAGASVGGDDGIVTVTTPEQPWHYAALLPLDLGGTDLAGSWGWLRLEVQVEAGIAAISLYDARRDLVVNELAVASGAGVGVHFIHVAGAELQHLMIRNGGVRGSARIRLIDARILTCPKIAEF